MTLLTLFASADIAVAQTLSVPSVASGGPGSAFVTAVVPTPAPSTTAAVPESAITIEVWNAAYSALVDDLPDTWGRRWLEQSNQPGSGAFTISDYDADFADITFGRVVRFYLDDVIRFAMIVEQSSDTAIAAGEEADEATTFSGRGHAAVLERAAVFPALGTGRVPFTENRYFNWASPDFDDSTWTAAVATPPKYGEVSGGVVTENFARPEGWPDDDAQWLWDRSSEEDGVPIGDVYLRSEFTVSNAGPYQVWAASDDEHEVWLDGVQILSRSEYYGGQSEHTDVTLDAGTHYLAAKASNLNNLKAGFVLTVVPINGDGSIGASIFRTQATTWVVVGYPDPVPGWRTGAIMRALIAEAQARGWQAGFATTFADDTDTDGNEWDITTDVVFPIGHNLLQAIARLAETYLDYGMQPASFTLNAWKKGMRGADSGVTYTRAVNILTLSHEGRG